MARPGQRELLFVFQDSNRQQSRRDRELQDAIRRSHAARNSARNAKRQKHVVPNLQPADNTRTEDETTAPRLPLYTPPRLPHIDALLASPPPRRLDEHEQTEADEAPVRLSDSQALSSTVLGQGRVDPFNVTVIANLPPFLMKHLDYAFDVFWPRLIPLAPARQVSTWWRRQHVEEPQLVHKQIAAATSIALKLEPNRTPARMNMILTCYTYHRDAALKWINDRVNEATGPPTGELIQAVLSSIMHDGETKVSEYTGYPQSPLATAQNVQIYGGVDIIPLDMALVKKLVDLAGGLEAQPLQRRTLAHFVDTKYATQTGSRPLWPMTTDIVDSHAQLQLYRDMFLGDSELSKLGTSFEGMSLNNDLARAITKCCVVTIGLDLVYHHTIGAPSMAYLTAFLTEAQNAVLSSRSDGLYEELIRTAVLLFNDLVLYVLPPRAGVRKMLLSQLQWLLIATQFDSKSREQRVWTWALMVGAAGAATLHDLGGWWTQAVASQSLVPVREDAWSEMKLVLIQYLWWEYSMDPPAMDMWKVAVEIAKDCG